MVSSLRFTLPLLAAVNVLAAPAADSSSPRCKEVSFTVTGNALNLPEPNITVGNPTNLTQAVANSTGSASSAVSGTQTLAGWFCKPLVTNANSTKLQVFRGSFFTNRESWTALGGTALFNPPLAPYQPYNYSWFDYANNLGYPTLAIDSLGDGLSSRPDPILLAQIPYEVSLYHNLIQQIRAGTTGQLPQTYSTLYHIGNSVGSQFGNNLAATHPEDIDAYVLTGYSKLVQPSLPGVALNQPAPAVLLEPTRFAGEPLGYVTSSIEASLTNSFFGNPEFVDFDPVVADLFFKRRDTVSLGIAITTYSGLFQPVAPAYTGRVLVLTGEEDQAYCGLGSAVLSPDTQCGPLLADTGSLFPAADYNYQAVPRAGHALILHTSARYSFEVAHQFLAGASFGK